MGYTLHNPLARDPLVVVTVFASISTLTVGLRLWSRKLRRLPTATDDYLIIGALASIPDAECAIQSLKLASSLYIFLLRFTTRVRLNGILLTSPLTLTAVLAGGVGHHVEDVRPSDVQKTLKVGCLLTQLCF